MEKQEAQVQPRDVIKVDKELIDNITNLIEAQDSHSILTILTNLHPADIAEIINHLNVNDAQYVFDILDKDTAVEVITELDEDLREEILSEIDKNKITDIVEELDSDDATDIVSELPEPIAEHVLENIDEEDSQEVKELLKYDEDTAGGLMSSDFVFVYDNSSLRDAIREVRKHAEEFEQIYHIYVLDKHNRLLGFVPLKTLLTHPLRTKITDVMEEDLIYVTPDVDQEEVARIMDKYDLVSLPVVDENKVMLGRITIDDIVDVIQEEAEEDLSKMAGLTDDEEFSHSVLKVSKIRMPWLLVSLFGELVSALVLSHFQASLEQVIVASFFIPIIMAMGGSSGQQAAIVMVRNLGTKNIWFSEAFKKLLKEFRVAMVNGIISAIILLLMTYFFFSTEIYFSMLLSFTLLIIMINATVIGAAVPILLSKIGVDPVVATGPFVATTNDIIGLLTYFIILSIFYIH